VARGLAARGIEVVTFNFPYMDAGRRVPDRSPILEAAFHDVWTEVTEARPAAACFAGGKSMGGRIASQVTASGGLDPSPAGLVLFGYPLHPPGKPAQRRDRHLSRLGVPALFLHGTRDPFGTPDEMTALTGGLPDARLWVADGGDHSLVAGKRVDPAARLLDDALDTAAGWMRERTGMIS
jgi:predicted alpha/beta-hydrolase family hydrolase